MIYSHDTDFTMCYENWFNIYATVTLFSLHYALTSVTCIHSISLLCSVCRGMVHES